MRDKGQPQQQKHTTLVKQCVGSFVSSTVVNTEELPDRSYGLSSLSEKTRESNHLHIIITKSVLSTQLFKDPECFGLAGVRTPDLPHGSLILNQLSQSVGSQWKRANGSVGSH